MTTRLIAGLAVLFTLLGCTPAEETISTGPPAPSDQIDAVQGAARTEDPADALRILRNTDGQAGPVLLTLKGILLAETGRYGRATSAMRGALRLVEEGKGLAAGGANLPRFRPVPKQHASGDLPAVTAERDLVKALRKAVHRDVTNEALLRALKKRSVPVRYPPLYEGGAGLTLEVLRQHFGDKTLRLQLLSYHSFQNGENAGSKKSSSGAGSVGSNNQARRRVAAQNLILASILARDPTRLKQGQKALEETLNDAGGREALSSDLQAQRRSALYLALADYLLGQRVQARSLPQKARRLLGSNL